MTKKTILDPCCGPRMFYFNPNNPDVVFGDIRNEQHILPDRVINISPDIEMDFRNMPFKDGEFKVVIFDPPHLTRAGSRFWMALKYGKLNKSWRKDLRLGFAECFRVLEDGGMLIFKWNETQIKVTEILKLTDQQPLIGNISGRRSQTHWIIFIKKAAAPDASTAQPNVQA